MILLHILKKLKVLSPNYLKLLLKDREIMRNKNLYLIMNKFKNTLNRVVLVGCGSSISKYKELTDVAYIGVNRSFKYENIKLDYLFIQDKFPEGMDAANNYKKETCKKFYGIIPKSTCYLQDNYLKTFSVDDLDVVRANANIYYLKPGLIQHFNTRLDELPIGDLKGTVFSALQFAIYLGAKEIFLVGCDCSSAHFYSSQNSKLNYQIDIWKKIKKVFNKKFPDVKIYSVNPVNLKGIFEDIYQEG